MSERSRLRGCEGYEVRDDETETECIEPVLTMWARTSNETFFTVKAAAMSLIIIWQLQFQHQST